MIEHWDGTQWRAVPTTPFATLLGIAAVSAHDIWAVGPGYYGRGGGTAVHWDGTRWTAVPTPLLGSVVLGTLQGVAAVSAADVWAVGIRNDRGDLAPLIEHWDGRRWGVTPAPHVGQFGGRLFAVTAISAHDIWAVGMAQGYKAVTLTYHWDGRGWHTIASPNAPGGDNILYGLTATSTRDVWAVGQTFVTHGDASGTSKTLVEHWDGHHWSIVPSANLPCGVSTLSSVTALSPRDVWATGYALADPAYGPSRTLVEHWNGVRWGIAPSPNPGAYGSRLPGVVAVTAHDVWAVGGTANANVYQTLPARTVIQHWDGTQWRLVTTTQP